VGEDAAQHHQQQQQQHTMSGRWAARPALFTAAQYEELEHQALIYKYLAAGVSVPPDLLVPLRRGFVYHQPARKHGPAPPSHYIPSLARLTFLHLLNHGVVVVVVHAVIWLFIRIEGFRCPPRPFVNRLRSFDNLVLDPVPKG